MVHQLTEGLFFKQRVHVLTEALPWLQHHRDRIVMVRYGGNAMTDLRLRKTFAQDIVFLRTVGVKPVAVHDGDPRTSLMPKRLGLKGEFRGGFRVTTPEVMEVVRVVLFGQVGRELVNLINAYDPYAVGISGEDDSLFTGTRRMVSIGGKETNIRLVGDITEMHSETLLDLIDAGRIPVVSTTVPSVDDKGVYNISADTAADTLISAINTNRLVIPTNIEGLYTDWPNRDSLASKTSTSHLREILPILDPGMIPKTESYLNAAGQGVPTTHAIDGRQPHSVLLELMTSGGIGTMVEPG